MNKNIRCPSSHLFHQHGLLCVVYFVSINIGLACSVRFVVTSRLTLRRLDHRATPPSHPVLHRAAGSSSHATAISPSHGRVPPDHDRPLRPRLVPAAAAY
ncbi:hypothetical protein DAPPUDRAFT_256495 [Daphnia pulex]|uniref:Uncharacterized protein n=1 Tax=Daphnia pulex TaxID=6669 RepID=E9HBH4_DAPPU|nr:hypothetical protein DAPPUDRAFT_256495 [Daphnia pulex]|eukprot:EFX70916.1 hypothetical protein DAPPUDRAFT_256495 [Daphnia pulex]